MIEILLESMISGFLVKSLKDINNTNDSYDCRLVQIVFTK